MAFGSHWEWRGFGGVDGVFVDCYSALPIVSEVHRQVDQYIYVPGLKTNLKIRNGEESGLKFKQFNKNEGEFELWSEYEDELFDFPISTSARDLLQKTLNESELGPIKSIPSKVHSSKDTLAWLREIGCRIIKVEKKREIRKLNSNNDSTLVEWTCIYEPQALNSISLESMSFEETDQQSSLHSLENVRAAYRDLELHRLPLIVNSYLDAVAIWSKSNKI